MRRYAELIIALAVAGLLVAVLRLFVVDLIVIPQEGARPVFHAGDRVWVNRTSFGLRLPGAAWWGYHRFHALPAERGQWVAFNNPTLSIDDASFRNTVFVGCVQAEPGDTLWMNEQGQLCCRRLPECGYLWELVVPAAGQTVDITPWNRNIYAQAIHLHEPYKAGVIGDSLCVDGRFVKQYRFQSDYYWLTTGCLGSEASQSSQFGFVPFTHLEGRLRCVLFSLPPGAPWYRPFDALRWGLQVQDGFSSCFRNL